MHTTNATRPVKSSRITNWKEYNDALGRRATLPLDLLEIQAPDWRSVVDTGKAGRPQIYSNGWIECIALLRQAFKQPYRQAVKLVERLIPEDSESQTPSWGHLAYRVRKLGQTSRFQRQVVVFQQALEDALKSGNPVILLVDSTGLSIRGPNSWRVDKPGAMERPMRTFQRTHLALNAASQQVLACQMTSVKTGDPTVLPGLLNAVTEEGLWVQSLAADGAYDTRGVYSACETNGISDVRIPPKEGAVRWKDTTPGAGLRNGHLAMGTRDRSFVPGKKAWKEATEYHVRSLVETAMSRMVSVTNQRLRNRTEDGQAYETVAAITLMNHYARLGLPEHNTRAYALPRQAPA